MSSAFSSIIKRKSFQDVFFVYGGGLVNGLSLFAINVLFARALTQDAFGTISLSLLVLSTVAEMSDLGLNGALSRFAPYYIANKKQEKLKQLVKTIWQWRIWMSAGLTVGGILVADLLARYVFGQEVLTPYFRLSFLGLGGVILLGFTSTYLKAAERFRYNARIQALKGVLRLLAIGAMVACGVTNLFWFLAVYIVVPWVLFGITYSVLPDQFQKVSIGKEERRQLHKELAKFSFWLTLWSLTAILSTRIDQAMLSHMLGVDDVALYAAAYQFVFLYALFQQSVSAVLLPKASGFTSVQQLTTFVRRVARWLVPAGILLIPLIFFSQWGFTLIFGDQYQAAIPAYLVLSMSMAISIVASAYAFIPIVYNRTDISAVSGIVQLLLNIVLNLYFIPRYGVVGAAYTFLIGIIFNALYTGVWSLFLVTRRPLRKI